MTITRWLRGRQQASTMMKAPSNTAALLRLASASNNCTASVPSSPSQQTFSCHENHHHLYIKFGPRDKQHQRRLPSLSCPLVFSPSSSLSFSTSSIPSTPSSPLEEIFGHERDSFYYREISKTNHKPLPVQVGKWTRRTYIHNTHMHAHTNVFIYSFCTSIHPCIHSSMHSFMHPSIHPPFSSTHYPSFNTHSPICMCMHILSIH